MRASKILFSTQYNCTVNDMDSRNASTTRKIMNQPASNTVGTQTTPLHVPPALTALSYILIYIS